MWVYAGLVLAMLFYGGSFVSTKLALTAFGPLTVLAVRLIISSVFLVLLDSVIRFPGRPSGSAEYRRWPARTDLAPILLVTLFQPILYFIAENFGLQYVSASIAAIMIATIPVFTPLIAGPLLGERLSPLGIVGLALSLAGVAVIVTDSRLASDFTFLGLLLIFVAVLAAVGYSISVRRTPARYRPLTIVKFQSLLGLPVILLLALLIEGTPETLPSVEVGLHLVYLGVFPSSIAFVFLSTGIRNLGASRANVFTNLVPGFTAVIAWLLVGELFTWRKVVGMLVVVAGVFAAQRGRTAATSRSGG
jgi:drug/metabolite transporter (DMT)-like permease